MRLLVEMSAISIWEYLAPTPYRAIRHALKKWYQHSRIVRGRIQTMSPTTATRVGVAGKLQILVSGHIFTKLAISLDALTKNMVLCYVTTSNSTALSYVESLTQPGRGQQGFGFVYQKMNVAGIRWIPYGSDITHAFDYRVTCLFTLTEAYMFGPWITER